MPGNRARPVLRGPGRSNAPRLPDGGASSAAASGARVSQHYLYAYPSKKALLSVMARVRALTRRAKNRTLFELLHRLNPVLRGWATYFKHGVSKRTFSYLGHFAWWRVVGWLRKRHPGITWAALRRRFLPGWRPTQHRIGLFNPATVTVSRYRYRGNKIPTPWTARTTSTAA